MCPMILNRTASNITSSSAHPLILEDVPSFSHCEGETNIILEQDYLSYKHMSPLDIFEDKDHNFWIISNKKIIKYNGTYFKIFNISKDLNIKNISVAAIDEKNIIWIATESKLIEFNGLSYNIIDNFFNKNESETYTCKKLLIKNNQIWLANNDGLFCYDKNKIIKYYGKKVASFEIDNEKNIWIGILNPFNKERCGLKKISGNIVREYIFDINSNDNFRYLNNSFKIFNYENNDILFTTPSGILKFNDEKFQLITLNENSNGFIIKKYFKTKNNNLLLIFANKIISYDLKNKNFNVLFHCKSAQLVKIRESFEQIANCICYIFK